MFKNAFISKQNEWTDQLKYCPSLLTTFLSGNFRIPSRKNDSSLEAIQFWSQFLISVKEVNRWLAASFGTTRRSNVRRIRRCSKTSHLNVSKYFFTTLATWGRALSWRRITLPCLCYSGHFSRYARLKRINYSRYRSLVMNRQVSAAHSKQDPFDPIKYRAWSSNYEWLFVTNYVRLWCWCWGRWSGLA